MKHRFEVSSRAEAELAALSKDERKSLLDWIERLVNGRVDLDETVRELDMVPHKGKPPWQVAEFSEDLYVFLRGLSKKERGDRGGIDPPEFLIRCIRTWGEVDAEVDALLLEAGVRREAALEAETERQEEQAEAAAKDEWEAEEREAGK